jgi:hypothetical protein
MSFTPLAPPTAAGFWTGFLRLLESEWTATNARTHYAQTTPWTEFMLGKRVTGEPPPPDGPSDASAGRGHGFLGRLGARLGYEGVGGNRGVTKEHYRVDQCWWVYEYGQKSRWGIDVAIEHENAAGLYTQEIQKLLGINCPLRVVIGYPAGANEGDLVAPERERIEEILDACDRRSERSRACGQPGEMLLVLGCGAGEAAERVVDWQAWRLLGPTGERTFGSALPGSLRLPGHTP